MFVEEWIEHAKPYFLLKCCMKVKMMTEMVKYYLLIIKVKCLSYLEMNLTVALPSVEKASVTTKIHCERKIVALPLSCLSVFVSTFTITLFSLLPLRFSSPNATFAFVSPFQFFPTLPLAFLPFFLFLCPSFPLISSAFVSSLDCVCCTHFSFFFSL